MWPGPGARELGAYAVPLSGGGREERLRRRAAVLEHAFGAHQILPRRRRGADLVAHELPQPARRWVERRPGHRITAARTFGTRRNPPFVGERLEVPAHGALRELERDAQLTHGELVPVEQQEQPTPGRIGERREAIEDGAGLYHPYIRMKG